MKKGSRSYFYAVLGCIAVLLAAAIVITAVALSGRKDDIAGIPDPGEIVTPGGDEPAAPSEPDKPDEPAPVTKPDGFYAPVADMNSLNLYGFYYNHSEQHRNIYYTVVVHNQSDCKDADLRCHPGCR